MQIKPFFDKYEELKRIPLLCDDLDNSYSLVIFRGIKGKTCEKCDSRYSLTCYKGENEIIEGAKVLCDKLETYANGSTAYSEDLFWKSEKHQLVSFIIGSEYGSYEIREISRKVHNAHKMFGKISCATTFDVKIILLPFFCGLENK